MRILWVVNTVFPDAAQHIGIQPPVFGGWMYGLASDLVAAGEVILSVATVYSGVEFYSFSKNGIQYYLIPNKPKNGLRYHWLKLIEDFIPELVHIHGTEFDFGMTLMKTCPNIKYVVSIQGLVSVCYRYYLAGISTWDVIRNITFRDVIRRDTLFQARNKFYKRGLVEIDYLRFSMAAIGRTDWDRANSLAINPKIPYYFCNESLRDEFYTGERWSLKTCRIHSIFVSQAAYPIKGLHQVLKAVSILKNKYNNIVVNVAGENILRNKSIIDKIRRSGYAKYIIGLIESLGVENNVNFLGPLSAKEMKDQYLKSHVFVCPSIVENSPNSLGEAQILGVPCVSSYCGGIPSMVTPEKSALLYSFGDYELLALKIESLFESNVLAEELSNCSIYESSKRHDRISNQSTLSNIYRSLIAKNS